jgi:hypothetical protein
MTVHKTAILRQKKVQDDNAQDDNAQNDDLQDHNVKNMSGLEIEHQDDNKSRPTRTQTHHQIQTQKPNICQ